MMLSLVWVGLLWWNKFAFLWIDVVLFVVVWFRIYAVMLFGSVLSYVLKYC